MQPINPGARSAGDSILVMTPRSLLLLGILLIGANCSTKPPEIAAPPTPTPDITKTDDGKVIKRSGWSIPALPAKRTYKREMRGETPILTSYSLMNSLRFTEPFDARGAHGWGRLESVTEMTSLDHKPFCYRLAAERDWDDANQDTGNQATGALVVAFISDTDGDGVFETLGGGGVCPVPDWAK